MQSCLLIRTSQKPRDRNIHQIRILPDRLQIRAIDVRNFVIYQKAIQTWLWLLLLFLMKKKGGEYPLTSMFIISRLYNARFSRLPLEAVQRCHSFCRLCYLISLIVTQVYSIGRTKLLKDDQDWKKGGAVKVERQAVNGYWLLKYIFVSGYDDRLAQGPSESKTWKIDRS